MEEDRISLWRFLGATAAIITIFIFFTGAPSLDETIKYFKKTKDDKELVKEKKGSEKVKKTTEEEQEQEDENVQINNENKKDENPKTNNSTRKKIRPRKVKNNEDLVGNKYFLDTIPVDYNYKPISDEQEKKLKNKIK